MNILYVTYGLPYPPHSGARMRDLNLIQHLARRHTIHLFSLLESDSEAEFAQALKPFCASVELFRPMGKFSLNRFNVLVRHIAARRPLAAFPFMHARLASRIRELAADGHIDAIQIEHSFLAPYVEALPRDYTGAKVLSLHNLGEQQYRRMAELDLGLIARFGGLIKSRLMMGWEPRYAARFDHVIVVSESEAQQLNTANPQLNVAVIENGVDTRTIQRLSTASKAHTVLFAGTMSYSPNVDAMLWFCNKILPRIRRAVPDTKLLIVGRCPAAAVKKLGGRPDILVTGRVPDVLPFYEQATISVIPLRAGGGTQLKVLEAMAYGRPVISTTVGCGGLSARDHESILIADSADAFAESVIALLANGVCRETLAQNARRLVETHYDWSTIGDKLLSLYDGLVR